MTTNTNLFTPTFGDQAHDQQRADVGELTEEDNYCLWQPEQDYERPRFVYNTPGGSRTFGTAVGPCVGRGGYPTGRQGMRARGQIVGRPVAAWNPTTHEELLGEELEGPGLDPQQDVRLVVAGSAWPRPPRGTRAARDSVRRPILDVPDRRPITYTLLSGQPAQFEDEWSPPSDPYYRTYYDKLNWGSGWRPPFYRGD